MAMDIRAMLPARSAEDILAGRVKVKLGGLIYTMPVLTIAQNREWKEALDVTLGSRITDLPDSATDQALGAMLDSADDLLLALIAYDVTGVLPEREAIEAVTQPHELLLAILEVWAAANPLLGMALAKALEPAPTPNRQARRRKPKAAGSSAPTNSRPTNGAGGHPRPSTPT